MKKLFIILMTSFSLVSIAQNVPENQVSKPVQKAAKEIRKAHVERVLDNNSLPSNEVVYKWETVNSVNVSKEGKVSEVCAE